MSDQRTPEQEIVEKIDSLKYKVESLQKDVRLTSVRDEIEDMDTQVSGLRPCVEALREQGYVFGKGLEAKTDGFAAQWRNLRPRAVYEIERQAPDLERELRPLENQLAQILGTANRLAAKPAVDRLDSALETLDGRVNAVKQNIEGMYDTMKGEVNTFKSALDRIDEMLKHFAEAAAAGTFCLLPTEGAVMVVKATYSIDEKMDKNDPQGFLFLTDQRILFEQNQEIATKKIFFITTEKEKVERLLFEVPVALIAQAQASKKGLFGHEDHLALTFKPGASVFSAYLHLDGQDCNEWQTLIGRARSGDFASERAVAIDQAEVDKLKAAPSQCPNCGGPVTQVVLRGMDSITCEYCKHVIRL